MKLKKLLAISATDISLIIFVAILILQQIYTIFFTTPSSNIDSTLDVVFRTSLASIFGYILSSRFAIANKIKKDTTTNAVSNTKTIGFNVNDSDNTTLSSSTENTEVKDLATPVDSTIVDNKDNTHNADYEENYCQIIITTVIGLLSLITLILYRNHIASNNAPTAAVSQLRDILSGSIGFLIGATSTK